MISESSESSAVQNQLSQKIEAAAWATQLAQGSTAEKASMPCEAGLGARDFLQALPTGRTRFEPTAFVVPLHVPEAGENSWCPKCDAVLDGPLWPQCCCARGSPAQLGVRSNFLLGPACRSAP